MPHAVTTVQGDYRNDHRLMIACVDGAVSAHASKDAGLRAFAECAYEFMHDRGIRCRLVLLDAAETYLLEKLIPELRAPTSLFAFVRDHFTEHDYVARDDTVKREIALTILAAFCAHIGVSAVEMTVSEFGVNHIAVTEISMALIHMNVLSLDDFYRIRARLGPSHAVYVDYLTLISKNDHLACLDKLVLHTYFAHAKMPLDAYACLLLSKHVDCTADVACMCVYFDDHPDICIRIVDAYVARHKYARMATTQLWDALCDRCSTARERLTTKHLRSIPNT
ncbi:hypothetical protein CYMTET_12334 [Cymbomonas tetramitiformis]|uniref:Uncharacterized protein n=1 Tax=Cymbomonas tetramitiformis TaxID=36881 RepID=A0AAE0LC89_9CHLO|nr:hypothetical protein CYMTET_12334 [Cymbomonas tetramitiformis]